MCYFSWKGFLFLYLINLPYRGLSRSTTTISTRMLQNYWKILKTYFLCTTCIAICLSMCYPPRKGFLRQHDLRSRRFIKVIPICQQWDPSVVEAVAKSYAYIQVVTWVNLVISITLQCGSLSPWSHMPVWIGTTIYLTSYEHLFALRKIVYHM